MTTPAVVITIGATTQIVTVSAPQGPAGPVGPAGGVTTGTMLSGSSRADPYDYNSLITGDLSQPEWSVPPIATPPLISPYSASDGTFSDLVQINAVGAAAGLGSMLQAFATPPGVGSVTFSISMSEASSKSVRLVIYAANYSTILGSLVCACTPTLQTFSFTATGLTPGTQYFASIEVNNAAQQAKPICGRATLTPIGGSNVFGGNFLRIRASTEFRVGSYGSQEFRYGTSWPWTNPQSEISLITSASRVAVCMGTQTGSGRLAFFAGGRAFSEFTSLGSASSFGYADVAIPGAPVSGVSGPVRVTVRDDEGYQNGGNFITALFVPVPTAHLQIVMPRRDNRQAIIYGDSITGGNLATSVLTQGWTSIFKLRYQGAVFLEQYTGRSFYTDTNNGTSANEKAFALLISKANATDVIFAIGTNDYGNAQWTAASFGASYARVLDLIHAALPNADVWCISPIHRSVETANALGDTLGAFRTQISTAQSTRAPWCHYIDGSAIPASGSLVDGTHPDTEGHASYARQVIAAMGI